MLCAIGVPHFENLWYIYYLVVQASYFLLTGSGEEEGVHLSLQGVVHLYINVIAGRLLLVIRVHTKKIAK